MLRSTSPSRKSPSNCNDPRTSTQSTNKVASGRLPVAGFKPGPLFFDPFTYFALASAQRRAVLATGNWLLATVFTVPLYLRRGGRDGDKFSQNFVRCYC